ncbi:DUF4326 domain-containing protein [Pararhizobium arenae]|uniref:DUF4326 domain-containing protein n=1 Tax=Pararhizobium arenae TaxID=1856850 RepID=UPI00094ACFA7|nr:DUF4326 domain-containing protein [Pararhizobium arenae]
MDSPLRLRLSRAAGFDLQALSKAANGLPAVNVARPSAFGNPYVVGGPVDRKQVRRWGWNFGHLDYVCADNMDAVRRFRACLLTDEAIHSHVVKKLGGRNLACWCEPDEDCHADVLLWFANRPQCQEVQQ